jgi:spore coat polysaccharide biosynthesis protein SpsF
VKTVVIVQARMTSTRLPGKVVKTVLGKSLLEYLIERLRRVRRADAFVIATTVNDSDQPIADLCARLEVPCTRGPEHDVLARYHEAARTHGATLVVRITSDCPLIDPGVIDATLALYQQGGFDYVTNGLVPGFPLGMSVEVFPFSVLDQAWREATAPAEREHVTPFIYTRPARFRIGHLRSAEDMSAERWTVDTPEDFELVANIIEALYPTDPEFGTGAIVHLLDQHPGWRAINAGVKQKRLGE